MTDMTYVKLPESNDPETMYVIGKWYKKVGDRVKKGDALVSYEQDKATVDILSECEGVVTELLVKEEDVVKPGTKICMIE